MRRLIILIALLVTATAADAQILKIPAPYVTASGTAAGSITFPTGSALRTGPTSGDTFSLSAYDVDGAAYLELVKLTAGNTPWVEITTLYGGSAANGDITIEPTTSATKTTSYVLLAPSGGNVGIGTTSPEWPLDVNGYVKASSGFQFGTLGIRDLAGIVTFDVGAAYPTGFNFQYGGLSASALYINSGGNVGIGTTSPAGLLHLARGTITDPSYNLNLTATWNDAADTFTGIFGNWTDTASAAGSLLVDLQVGGASKISGRKDGLWTAQAFAVGATAGCSGTPTAATYGIATTCTGPEASPDNLLAMIQQLQAQVSALQAQGGKQ